MTAAPNARTAVDQGEGGATGAGAVRNCLRGGLVLLAAIQAGMGGWQYLAPRSFYYGIPTVSADRPFSAHLMTDVGGLNLALAVVLAAAAWRLDRTLTRAALAAFLVDSGSHLAFHATDPASLTPGQRPAACVCGEDDRAAQRDSAAARVQGRGSHALPQVYRAAHPGADRRVVSAALGRADRARLRVGGWPRQHSL